MKVDRLNYTMGFYPLGEALEVGMQSLENARGFKPVLEGQRLLLPYDIDYYSKMGNPHARIVATSHASADYIPLFGERRDLTASIIRRRRSILMPWRQYTEDELVQLELGKPLHMTASTHSPLSIIHLGIFHLALVDFLDK